VPQRPDISLLRSVQVLCDPGSIKTWFPPGPKDQDIERTASLVVGTLETPHQCSSIYLFGNRNSSICPTRAAHARSLCSAP
jgi:hypothetical protein